MQQDASREEMIAAKAHVRSLLDESTFEHVSVDIELEGELCVVGTRSKHADNDQHIH
jgi:hypothetical protein